MQINDVTFNADLSDILTELQSQLSINNISLLTKMKDSGTDIMVQCPYHGDGQERRPSAGIRKSDGLFHCFACNETHTLAEVISHCFGEDSTGIFGWKWLLKNFGTVSVEERKDVVLDFSRGAVIYRDSSRQHSQQSEQNELPIGRHTGCFVTEEELDSYRYTHPYMYKRKLTDEIIEKFDIGYDSNTKCITFPIRDITGATLFVARRSVLTKYFNYPADAKKPLYGIYELSLVKPFPKEVIVCESMLDALSFWTVGKYAVALNGLGNELQFKQLRELPCRKLILATDMDERGISARKRIRMNVQNSKIITEYFFPAGKKDANDCTQEELLALVDVF